MLEMQDMVLIGLLALSSILFIIIIFILKNNTKKNQTISELKKQLTSLQPRFATSSKDSSTGRSYEGMKTSLISEQLKKIEQLEHEIERQKQRVLDAKEIAQEAVKIKYEFLSNIRHEIRTPLNSIIAYSTLLIQNLPTPKLNTYAKNILSSSNTLLSMMDNIIELSKIEAGKYDIKEGAVDIDFFMKSLVKRYMSSALKKGLRLHLDIDTSLPESIMIDADKVKSIVENLISNSIKFTKKGLINVYVKPNGTNVLHNTLNLQIIVEDTGMGIKKEEQYKIFQMFEHIVGTEGVDTGSMGLGLSIDKKIANLMRGDLNFYSEYTKGSTFILSLNDVEIVLANAQDIVDDSQISFAYIRPDGAKAMVIDQDVDTRNTIRESFLESHVQLSTFESPRDAIEELKKKEYDLIFIDLDVLSADHNAISKVIAKISKAPVVTLTDGLIKHTQLIENGAKVLGHLKKPIAKHELFKISMALLNSSKLIEIDDNEGKVDVTLFDMVSSEQIKNFLQEYEQNLASLYKNVQKTNDLQNTKKFATQLYDLAIKTDIVYFQTFANQLLHDIKVFNIDAINDAIEHFEIVMRKLKI